MTLTTLSTSTSSTSSATYQQNYTLQVTQEPLSSKKDILPQEYFNIVKGKRQKITDEELAAFYDNCLTLINKYQATGQLKGLSKLIFHLDCIERERELVKLGIDTFVYKDDIEEYIDTVADNTVKIIELKNYEREIPDEIVDTLIKVKPLFDELYIVFTDYTGKEERKVAKERRSKDPIIFGAFLNEKYSTILDRFYYVADWVDDFCDLTLDKLVGEMKTKADKQVAHKFSTPTDLATLKAQVSKYRIKRSGGEEVLVIEEPKNNQGLLKPQTIFSKIRSALGI